MKALFQSVKMRWDGQADVVLYEESLDTDVLYKAVDYISRADVLIVGGHPWLFILPQALWIITKGTNWSLSIKQQLLTIAEPIL